MAKDCAAKGTYDREIRFRLVHLYLSNGMQWLERYRKRMLRSTVTENLFPVWLQKIKTNTA